MIDWWGPIIDEYYGMTEGMGVTACDSAEWLAHKGTVGRTRLGELHILDENMHPCPMGTVGTMWFKLGSQFEYFNDRRERQKSCPPTAQWVLPATLATLMRMATSTLLTERPS